MLDSNDLKKRPDWVRTQILLARLVAHKAAVHALHGHLAGPRKGLGFKGHGC